MNSAVGVGFGIENALDNTANLITSVKGGAPAKARRQLAGEGAAADSILTDTDNGKQLKDVIQHDSWNTILT